MRPTKSLGIVLLCLTAILPGMTLAATAPEVQAIRDDAFRAASQMMMFVALDKAKERRASADKSMTSIDGAVAGINDPNLSAAWQKTRATLAVSPYDASTVNQRVLYAWENEIMAFTSALDNQMPPNIDRNRKDLYDLVARMQVMVLIYLRNSTDPLGGTNYTGVNVDKELGAVSKQFTARLAQAIQQNPKHAVALGKAKAKWSFLSGRIADYSKQNVPFIVDLYGRQIIDILLASANAG